MTTNLPYLTNEESAFVYEQSQDNLSVDTNPRRAFGLGFRAAKLWFKEQLDEMDALREQAQRDKNDATKAHALLAQAEKRTSSAFARIEQLSDHLGIPYVYEPGAGGVPDAAEGAAPFDEGFRDSEEEQAFTVAYEAARAMSFSIMDTAKVAWMYARRYFEPATTEAEGSKPVATKPPRSPQQLREMAVHIAHRYWTHNADRPLTLIADNVLLFLQEPGKISLRELAAHIAQNLTQAREIYEYLSLPWDSTSDFTD